MKIIEGNFVMFKGCFVIVVGCFNGFVVELLVVGVCDVLVCYGVKDDNIELICVLGVWEILLVVQKVVVLGKYVVVIVLGVVICGVILYFDYVVSECVKGLVKVGMDIGVLVVFGVLMIDFIEQVIECFGIKVGNKGVDVVLVVLEMVNLYGQL